ncbi:NAD-dependent protein deacylase [Weissella halotolerans]|uniref:protein acetyllysine N-acetyltransferase n=1 Tax=Weissella halotolerans DSM 20190 TaxID=1123500 RepID=A0A0R2G8D5_9LACO|nr:NAD-dependent protein deacylase [Weissella halotolerans]KRN33548.1 NAD-dependent deacetylase (regulatory protein SIR2 family protein) [Weissella halotolerans DSM 20190]
MRITASLQSQFDQAQHIVFLTGAGVSTPSGIPDYRSKGGIYDGVTERPEYLLSVDALNKEPEKMYRFMMDNMYFPQAKPNIIHQKMAQLTQANRATIITQNVDQLHEKAGAKNVIDYHGSLYNIYGLHSHRPASFAQYQKSMYNDQGELLRPGITLYGEMPPHTELAIQAVQQADFVVIVGTSFVVYPFASLLQFVPAQVPILSINLETIPAPARVEQVIADASDFFTQLKL